MEHLKIQKKKCVQLLSFVMSFLLLVSSFTLDVSAENLQSGQHAKTSIENEAFENSVYSYNSEHAITYDEFIEMSAKLFHYDKVAQTQKITLKNWFAKNITDIGTEKTSNQLITRQDAAVILAKMLKYNGSSEDLGFTDKEQISDYAKESINILTKKGYLTGYPDGTFKPNNSLSKEEAEKFLQKASGEIYSEEGIYDLKNKTIKSNLSVVAPGIIIKNAIVEGDLYISEAVGTGNVNLENVTVKGETIVSGGGMNSVVFINTKLGTLRVETPDDVPVRIVASGDTNINMTQMHSEGKLQTDGLTGDGFKGIVIEVPSDARVSLDGNFPSVIVDSPKAKLDLVGGKADNIIVSENAGEAKINIASTASVGSMEINAKSTVGGTGKIDTVSIASENVTIAQKPNTVEVGNNINASVNNEFVSTGIYGNHSNKGSSSNKKIKVSNSGKVILESGSEGIAGNACITGLEKGQRYYIIVYKDKKSYPITKDGKLGIAGSIAYDTLEPLETDAVENLTNYEKYKVIKVLPSEEELPPEENLPPEEELPAEKEDLQYSYKEIEQRDKFLFVEVFFEEPIEFLVNKQNISNNALKNSFVYRSETESGKIENIALSKNKKSIIFTVPKNGLSYEISLSDEAKKDDWKLRGMNTDSEYKQIKDIFLDFKIIDFQNSPLKVKGPEDVTVFAGEKAVFQANAESDFELNYEWYRNEEVISGATEDSYSFTTGLTDNASKYSVKVWIETSDDTREFIISKTAFLTVKSKGEAKVILEDGSEGTAGNACILGLEKGQKYYIITYRDNKMYSVMKNGTLGEEITEPVYSNLEALETDTISNLVNEEKYKVVKVLEPAMESLLCSYKEVEQSNKELFVKMFFEEPVEFLVNKQNVSNDVLKNSFVYRSGTQSGKVEDVVLSEDKKSILFVVPKVDSSYEIFLSDEAKKDQWILKSIESYSEYKQMMDVFLEFTLINSKITISGPEDLTAWAGKEAKFEVKVQGESSYDFNYQWYKGDEIIEGATKSIYSFIPAISDNGSKYSVNVWVTSSDNLRELVRSNVALLTVEIPEVLLTEDSEGLPDDESVTGLEEGSRYFITVVNDNKSYPVMKDGTLGSENTELTYDKLQPLETTVITGLTNKELYTVVKVLPKENMPLLEALKISGLTNNLSFLGYVSPTIDGEVPLSENTLKLQLKPMKQDAEVSVAYRVGSDPKQEVSCSKQDGYFNCNIPLNFTSDTITISVNVSEEGSDKPMVYTIKVSRAANIIVTTSLSSNVENDSIVSRKPSELEYYIKYMKSTETFDGITCKKTSAQTGTEEITLIEGTNYTKEVQTNKAIKVKMTKEFYENLVKDDILEFKFKFSGGDTVEKVCKVKIYQNILKYNLKFGEPILIDPKQAVPQTSAGWLNIFVPIDKESGEAFESLDDINNSIDSSIRIALYNDATNIGNAYNTGSAVEYNGQKGVLVKQSLPYGGLYSNKKYAPNKYKLDIRYYEISETGEISTEYHISQICDIPIGEEVKGNVEFSCASNAPIEVNPKPGTTNEFVVTLTKENKPIYHSFKWEDKSSDNGAKFYSSATWCQIVTTDSDYIYIKAAGDEPELGYMFANMNSIPKIFLYDYEGDVVESLDYITNYLLYVSSYGDLGYYFRSDFKVGSKSFYTVKDLKEKRLQPENISFTIGTKEDGTFASKTMQNLLDDGYFGENNTGDADNRNIRYLYLDSVRELFAAFNFNPSQDTIAEQVTLSAKLNEGVEYKLKDKTTDTYYINSGKLNKLIIKDKNDSSKETSLEQLNPGEVKNIEVPYKEAAILISSSGGQTTIFDEDGILIDSDNGLILTENESRRFSIVVAKGGELPKIYKFDITYQPETPSNVLFRSSAKVDNTANVSFINITDDMSEEEVKNILESIESEEVKTEVADNAQLEGVETPEDVKPEVSDTPKPEEPDNKVEESEDEKSEVSDTLKPEEPDNKVEESEDEKPEESNDVESEVSDTPKPEESNDKEEPEVSDTSKPEESDDKVEGESDNKTDEPNDVESEVSDTSESEESSDKVEEESDDLESEVSDEINERDY